MPRRHLSMLRSYTAADALTIGNAACGTIAIFLCLEYLAAGGTRIPVDRVSAVAAGAGARRPRRLRRAPQPVAPIGAWIGPRFTGRRHLVWRGARRARLHAWPARWVGHGDPDLLRRLRREPARAVQRHRLGAGGRRDRQGEVLRRHADPDERRLVGVLAVAFWLGRIDGELWFGDWRLGPATLHPLSLMFGLSGSAMISATLRVPKP